MAPWPTTPTPLTAGTMRPARTWSSRLPAWPTVRIQNNDMADAEAITPQTHQWTPRPLRPAIHAAGMAGGRWPLVGGARFVGYKINRLDSGDRFRTASAPPRRNFFRCGGCTHSGGWYSRILSPGRMVPQKSDPQGPSLAFQSPRPNRRRHLPWATGRIRASFSDRPFPWVPPPGSHKHQHCSIASRLRQSSIWPGPDGLGGKPRRGVWLREIGMRWRIQSGAGKNRQPPARRWGTCGLGHHPRSYACRRCASTRARCRRPHAARQQVGAVIRPYSITSSTRASSVGGTVRPRALAAFRLMTNSNLVGCWTGKSAGWAPLRILCAYVAVCRDKSGKFAP